MKNSETFFLVRRLKKGDLSSFEKIYKMYYSKLHGFSKKFHLTTLQPDDFVQQTFLKLWDERGQLSEDILLDKQLFVICRNLILNHLKREKKIVSDQDYQHNLYETSDRPFELASKGELNKLNAVIKKLPKKRKEIFKLHKIENLTYEEIAEFLCISKKTIANHIYLASNFLKEECRKP
jgi:RNA polymerase sigma-70 factor (ECF subfamily)